MKKVLKSQKGINLISLSIAVIMILIITNVILYNVKSNLGIQKLQNMQTDIKNLRDKISTFYAQNGKIPASIEYTNINNIKQAGVISTAVDTGKFYVIDLASIDNLTLNYGQDYKKIKSGNVTTSEEINNLVDLYIINETSHNIFYVEGIEYDNEWFYTDYTVEDIETKAVDLIDINAIDGWSPTYDKTATYKDKNGDTAIIPEGFKVSRNPGEDTIQNGLVVRGPDESEFVWVPVEDINNMAQCSTAGGTCKLGIDNEEVICRTHNNTDIVGKLYATSLEENFTANIPNTIYKSYAENETASEELGLREPDELSVDINDNSLNTIKQILKGQTDKYNDSEAFKQTLRLDYKEMIKSIEKYGGFYIARYEMSTSDSNIAQSKANENSILAGTINSLGISWYGLYAYGKTYDTDSVASSMVWGSQYDAMLRWIDESGNSVKENIGDLKNTTQVTGSVENDKIKNIYDLYGGSFEWTLEAYQSIYRVYRGRLL